MDAVVKQMVEGYEAGLKAQEGMVRDAALVDAARAVIARMKAVANEPGVDVVKFQQRLGAEGLMEQYAAAMAKLGEAMMATAQAAAVDAEATAKQVDIKDIDLTDLNVILAPHRAAYQAVTTPRARAAYEALFALGKDCRTIPEFNRRAQGGGHYAHLGMAATWDANENTLRLEVEHRQPDMVTYALDALTMTRDQPFPDSIAYALTALALRNERAMARRWNAFTPFNCFTGELSSYLILNHSEGQRRKVVNLYELQREYTGLDFDAAVNQPYFRLWLTLDDENKQREHGADYLGIIPFLRVGWFTDAALTPDEKKAYADRGDFPRPPAAALPYRTGPVGGVDLVWAPPPFASPFDRPYAVKLTLVNGGDTARKLDASRGVRAWVWGEKGLIKNGKVAEVPATLAPGESVTVEGDLYAWGLPREERLYLVAFDAGGAPGADLAAKYGDPQKVTPMFVPNFYLTPFAGGVATEPAFVMPHRPPPPYPFPLAGV